MVVVICFQVPERFRIIIVAIKSIDNHWVINLPKFVFYLCVESTSMWNDPDFMYSNWSGKANQIKVDFL